MYIASDTLDLILSEKTLNSPELDKNQYGELFPTNICVHVCNKKEVPARLRYQKLILSLVKNFTHEYMKLSHCKTIIHSCQVYVVSLSDTLICKLLLGRAIILHEAAISCIYCKTLKIRTAFFSKYSLIRNKFWKHDSKNMTSS